MKKILYGFVWLLFSTVIFASGEPESIAAAAAGVLLADAQAGVAPGVVPFPDVECAPDDNPHADDLLTEQALLDKLSRVGGSAEYSFPSARRGLQLLLETKRVAQQKTLALRRASLQLKDRNERFMAVYGPQVTKMQKGWKRQLRRHDRRGNRMYLRTVMRSVQKMSDHDREKKELEEKHQKFVSAVITELTQKHLREKACFRATIRQLQEKVRNFQSKK